jgi:hypothetical protein
VLQYIKIYLPFCEVRSKEASVKQSHFLHSPICDMPTATKCGAISRHITSLHMYVANNLMCILYDFALITRYRAWNKFHETLKLKVSEYTNFHRVLFDINRYRTGRLVNPLNAWYFLAANILNWSHQDIHTE